MLSLHRETTARTVHAHAPPHVATTRCSRWRCPVVVRCRAIIVAVRGQAEVRSV